MFIDTDTGDLKIKYLFLTNIGNRHFKDIIQISKKQSQRYQSANVSPCRDKAKELQTQVIFNNLRHV